MDFLLDENVPHSVGRVLEEFGHDVAYVTDCLSTGSPDQLVATAAVQMGRILVSHDRDMRRIERFVSPGDRDRFPTLSRLMLCCIERQAAERVRLFMPIVEAEFARVRELEDKRLFFEIGNRRVRIHR